LPKTGVTREVDAQGQRIHEKTNQRFHFHFGPICDGCSSADVSLPRIAMKQSLQGSQQGHEEGSAFAAAQDAQRFGQAFGEKHYLARARNSLSVRPGIVGGELKHERGAG
jgi:hypothetical protein